MVEPMLDKGGFGSCESWHATYDEQKDCVYCEVVQLHKTIEVLRGLVDERYETIEDQASERDWR